MILGQRVSMHYSDPKPRANEDWLCNKVVCVCIMWHANISIYACISVTVVAHSYNKSFNSRSYNISTVWCAKL